MAFMAQVRCGWPLLAPPKWARLWRSDPEFQAALQSPVGSPARKGHWAVFGIARGPMQGHSGQSYGIQTVVRPGQRQSVSLSEIGGQLEELTRYAKAHPETEFLITRLGTGYAGYTEGQILKLYRSIGWPENCTFL